MNKIAMKLVDMNIKTAAGITTGMLRGNALRNMGKMLMHKPGSKVRMDAMNNMHNATYLFGRELAATRGKSYPKALKAYGKSYRRVGNMQNIANKLNKPELADRLGQANKKTLNIYSKFKRGINPVPTPAATRRRSFQNTLNKFLKSYDNNADFWKR